jgi:hypothetical protein
LLSINFSDFLTALHLIDRPGGEVVGKQSEAGFDYSDFESAMSKFDTTFQV